MPVTMEQVHAMLDPDEPDYARAVELGSEALPHLNVLVSGGDPMLASKATYLVSLIAGEESVQIISNAAWSADPILRVAAASAAGNLSGAAASEILLRLVGDKDQGVRKTALNSVGPEASMELRTRIDELRQNASDRQTRELATEVWGRFRKD